MKAIDAPVEPRWDAQGLVAGVVQHATSGEVLMVGYLNEESWRLTLQTKRIWFWSRSRNRLWEKGETSGNRLNLLGVRLDCDGDVLLLLVEPAGPTCHTGERSCFHWSLETGPSDGDDTPRVTWRKEPDPPVRVASGIVEEIFSVIQERKRTLPEGSYVSYLLTEGVDKIDKKMGEETAEVIVASKNHEPGRLASEMADLWFHSLVLLAACDVSPSNVWEQLRHRRPKRLADNEKQK